MELNPTGYVILGMLSAQPQSGYEIKALVDTTTRFFWAASYGQIYPELKRLSELGLIEGMSAPTGGRRRTVYRISSDGRAALRDWLRQPPATYEMREEGLLKLFFAGALPPGEGGGILASMREHRLNLAQRLRSMEPEALAKEDPFPLMVLRAGIEFNEWFAGWCERTERQLLNPVPERGAADV
ncbi:MAG: PadR family transcriptional regulator [Solirubrobacterales bacterium]